MPACNGGWHWHWARERDGERCREREFMLHAILVTCLQLVCHVRFAVASGPSGSAPANVATVATVAAPAEFQLNAHKFKISNNFATCSGGGGGIPPQLATLGAASTKRCQTRRLRTRRSCRCRCRSCCPHCLAT